jgi:hypothetical protein
VNTPTAARQPLGRATTIAEHFLHGLAWVVQACAATTYLIVTIQPAAWQKTFAKDPVSVAFLWLIALTMAFLWAAGLWEESRRFYDRRLQQLHRKTGYVGHLGVLLIAVAAAVEQPHWIALLIILGMMAFAAFGTWATWMQLQFLPDEDQAVIDTIIHREAAERAATFDASEREKRRVRLTAIVENLGYTLTDAPAQAEKPADAPVIKWTIPAGKHAPLVYFVRNGNRIKIGTTVELKRRIRTLALRPENVALLVDGDQRRERQFHKQFAEHRIGTTEWFAYEGTLANYVHDQADRISRKGQEQ